MNRILLMSEKMATSGLLKIIIFGKKTDDVIIFVNGVTNKILSRDSNYNVNAVMWSKFGNSSISGREVTLHNSNDDSSFLKMVLIWLKKVSSIKKLSINKVENFLTSNFWSKSNTENSAYMKPINLKLSYSWFASYFCWRCKKCF